MRSRNDRLTREQKIEVTIIIPAYNARETINRTLKSCLNQVFLHPYEIIVIDDGSTDNTVDVINKFSNDKIRYFYQANSGPLSARKNGLLFSRGNYIAFLDSDDVLLPSFLQTMYNQIVENEADIVCCLRRINDDDIPAYKESIHIFNSREEIIKNHLSCGLIDCCFPSKIYKKNILDSIRNLDTLDNLIEDVIVMPVILDCCNKICVVNKHLYQYNKSNTGRNLSNSIKGRLDDIRALFIVYNFLKSKGYKKKILKICVNRIFIQQKYNILNIDSYTSKYNKEFKWSLIKFSFKGEVRYFLHYLFIAFFPSLYKRIKEYYSYEK